MTVMWVTVRHNDGYKQSYAAAILDKTALQAYEHRLAIATCGGGMTVEADPTTFTIRISGDFTTTEITFSDNLTNPLPKEER